MFCGKEAVKLDSDFAETILKIEIYRCDCSPEVLFSYDGNNKLETNSLDSLGQHCPLCGKISNNFFCKDCVFKWEADKLYFTNSNSNIYEK